jgi:hypothetical protein
MTDAAVVLKPFLRIYWTRGVEGDRIKVIAPRLDRILRSASGEFIMARRLRCPCGNNIDIGQAAPGSRFQCPACKKTLSLPGSASPSKTNVPAVAGASKAVAPSTAAPKAVTSSGSSRPKMSLPPANGRRSRPVARNRWPLIAAIAGVLLLTGGGTAAWLILRKPADTVAEVKDSPKKQELRKDDTNDKKLDVPEPPKPFTLAGALNRPDFSPGTQAKLIVRASRDTGYTGEITLTLDDLPEGIKGTAPSIAENGDAATVQLDIASSVKPGRYAFRLTGKTSSGSPDYTTYAPDLELVVVAPFELKVEAPAVTVMQGGKGTLNVTVVRKGGYDGKISLDWKNLPMGVVPAPTAIAAGESSAKIDFTATANAVLGNRADVQVVATAPDQPALNATLAINVTALPVVKPPFELALDPVLVKVLQGGKASVKAMVKRNEYMGPITVELKGLPQKVEAQKITIPANTNLMDIELNAAADAVKGDTLGVYANGMTADAAAKPIMSGTITVQVTTLFDLAVDPVRVKINQGGKATIKVTAKRDQYTGPIDIELRNLPAGVTAPKVTIAKDQTLATVELTATDTATTGIKTDVLAAGNALDLGGRQILSPPFTLEVVGPTTTVLFDYQLDPPSLRLTQGGTTKLRVSVIRRDYKGAITIDLRNLPARVTTTSRIIAATESSAVLDVTAVADAVVGDTNNVVVLGTPVDLANKQVPSQPFTVSVTAGGTYDLKVDSPPLQLKAGTKATIRVTATRRGYDGAINIELRNLPTLVKAANYTIGAGTNSVDIDVTADPKAPKSDATDVRAIGTAKLLGSKEIASQSYHVSVKPATPATFELKADAVTIHPGGTAKLRVTAVRKGYDGPINIEVKNLPMHVTAPKATIPAGQNSVELVVAADIKAGVADHGNLHIHGTADMLSIESPAFKVSVKKK